MQTTQLIHPYTFSILKRDKPQPKPKEPLTIEKIERIVCKYYRVDVKQLYEKSRKGNIPVARQLIYYLCCIEFNTEIRTSKIGMTRRYKQDHTTALHGIAKVTELIQYNSIFQEDYKKVLELLNG